MLLEDVRYAFRRVRRHRSFGIVVIICLACGIGANAAIFSAINALLLKSLQVQAPQQLIQMDSLNTQHVNTLRGFSYPGFELLRKAGSPLLSGMFAYSTADASSSVFSALSGSTVVPAKQLAPCQTSQLLATEDVKESDGVAGGAGHLAATIAIQNRSSSPCFLQGVPKLELSYTASGLPLAVRVCSNCNNYLFHPQPVNRIVLEPKRSAYLVLGFDDNDGNGTCTEADPKFLPRFEYSAMTLSLFLKDQHRSPLKVRFDEWRSCGVIDITPFLEQHPVDGSLQ
jgi:hypothetical protein